MELPIVPIKASTKNPRLLTLFGQSKVGKTTMLAKLPNCLIIDTEKGTSYVDALKVNVNSILEFIEVRKAIKEAEHKYDYIAIDTIDNVVLWVEQNVCAAEGVKNLADIPFGGGYSQVREQIMKIIGSFKQLTDHVILVAHRKKTMTEENTEFAVSSLDLSGKLKNVISADSDAIGYVFRATVDGATPEDEKIQNLMISFKTSDYIEAGARPEHLRGQILPFEWKYIFID